MQAIAALASVLLTALVIFGLVRDPAEPPPASPSREPGQSMPAVGRVTLETVVTSPTEVSAEGSYENLAAERETVLFIGQPQGEEDGQWLPVEASMFPSVSGAAGTQSGRWTAARPAVSGRYLWYAVIAPDVPGAGGTLDDLRARGPDSGYVTARSEPEVTD